MFVFASVIFLCFVFCSHLVNDLLAHCDDVGVLLPQHHKPLQPIHFAWQPEVRKTMVSLNSEFRRNSLNISSLSVSGDSEAANENEMNSNWTKGNLRQPTNPTPLVWKRSRHSSLGHELGIVRFE